MGQQEPIMKKIKALLDKSRSTDSEAESQIFMKKAQELLLKYNLETHHVEGYKDQKSKVCEEMANYGEDWEWHLMGAICRSNFCKCIGFRHGNMSIIGTPDNIYGCLEMFKFYFGVIGNLMVESYQKTMGENEKLLLTGFVSKKIKNDLVKLKKTYCEDYCIGAVHGIDGAMKFQKQEMRSQAGVNEIMIIKEDEVEEYIRMKYPRLRSVGSGGRNMGMGYDEGIKDGANVGSGVRDSVKIERYLN